MQERILITGAGGFLGTHLCQYFGNRGQQIAAVGRFLTTLDTSQYPNIWRIAGMTLPDQAFVKVVREFQPEILIHCAGTSSVPLSVADPFGDFQKSVELCAFVLDTLRRMANRCIYVFLSSAAVYGNPQQLPISESSPPNPVSPYGYHKWMCETIAEEYSNLHKIHTIVLRIFSAYGERLRKQVIFDLCRNFADPNSSTIELFGTGSESRDFIHAVDVGRAIETLVVSGGDGIFNLGTGVQTTIANLASLIGEQFSNPKPIAFDNLTREGDPRFWQADISKIRSLGFTSSIDLAEGIERTCQWFRTHYLERDSHE